MMLVIDVTKGMQTQSAECLVIGQIACQKLVVVLNKTDLLPEGKRQAAIEKMTRKMQKTLENTKWVCRGEGFRVHLLLLTQMGRGDVRP